ncbi:MAG: TIGR04013 family B12-binding domain/radical SAM domain-containing protein [Thermodesulforhabdaceae bacterium]
MDKTAVVFLVDRNNRWSLVALVAAFQRSQPSGSKLIWVDLLPSYNNLLQIIKSLLGEYKQIVLAYSFMTPQWAEIKKEWKNIKDSVDSERVFIIAGGAHPTGAVKAVIDAGCWGVLAGEGEESFPQVIDYIQQGAIGNAPPGLYRSIEGKIQGKKALPVLGWEESFPFPTNPPLFSPIEITRGCPFKCTYCSTPIIKGTKVRHRTVSVIVEAVKFMIKQGKKDVRFITPNALSYGSTSGKEPNLEALDLLLGSIRQVLPPDGRIFFGSFPSEVRPEFVNEETARILKTYCANKQIVVGAQSGSDRMLRLMRRGHTVEDVLKACEILPQFGFTPAVDIIFGLPGEDEEDMRASLNVIDKLSQIGARIHAHYFMPLPGSRWANLSPTPLPQSLRRQIERLIAQGKLFGQWMHQERFAIQTTISLALPKQSMV